MIVSELELAYPHIKWRVPLAVQGKYGCRICIAVNGVKCAPLGSIVSTRHELDAHFKAEHLRRRSR